jgi:Flp pilus assembly protein TadG
MKGDMKVSRRKRQGGNAIIEFSLCAGVLLMMACGVTDFARLFNLANMSTGAASAGLGYASISPANWSDFTDIQTAALNDTGNYPGATATATNFCTCGIGETQVSCPATCSTGTAQTYVQVSVTIPFSPIFHYPGVPNPINVTQVACARVQ